MAPPVGRGAEDASGPLAPPTELGVEPAGRVAPVADAGADCLCPDSRRPAVAPLLATPSAWAVPSLVIGLATPGMPRCGQSRTCSTNVLSVFNLGVRPGAMLRIPTARTTARTSATTVATTVIRLTRRHRPPLKSSKTIIVLGACAPVPDEMTLTSFLYTRPPDGGRSSPLPAPQEGSPRQRLTHPHRKQPARPANHPFTNCSGTEIR